MRLSPLACWGIVLATALTWGGLSATAQEQPTTDAATRQYAAAVALQNRGVYDLAAEEWQKFVETQKDDPRVPKAYHYLGICNYQLGKYDAALKAFQTVVDRYPKSEQLPASLLHLGVTQYALGQSGKREMYEQASRTLATLLSKYPQGEQVPDALYYRGECLYALGSKAEAVRLYSQLVEKHPQHKLAAEALYALGVAQEESNQPEAAAKTYDTFLARFSQHRLATEVGMRRGETFLATGDLAEAAKRFAAAAGAPGFALADYATLRYADTLLQLKQYGEAAAAYASIPAKFPKSQHLPRAALSAGKAFFLAGDYGQARQTLTRLVEAGGPSAPEAAHWLAQTLLKARDPNAALAVVERAIAQAAQGPTAAQLLMDRADIVSELPQRRKEAVNLYAEVAAKHPKDPIAPQALYMAAFLALEQGEYNSALARTKTFLSAYRDHALVPDVMRVAAESSVALSKFADADRFYGELIKRFSQHADADVWKVRRVAALHAQKKFRETIAALEPLLRELRSPESVAEARFLIGSSQFESKQYADAAKSLTAALETQPKWRRADETLLLLAQAYRETNDLEKAKAAVTRLIAEYPSSRSLDWAQFRLGEYHWLSGDFAAAAEAYRQVTAKWPDSPLAAHALHELGCALLNQKDAAGAETTLTTFLDRYPRHSLVAHAHYARGMARHQLKKFGPAIEDLQAMLAADPGSKDKPDARFLFALCQIELKQYDAAAGVLRTLLQESPDYRAADKAEYQLAWALKLSGKEDDAARVFMQLVAGHAQSPLAAEAQHNVGEYAYQSKNYAAAANAYYPVVQQADGTPLGEKACHKLAWCYYHQGNFANAEKTFAYQVKRYADGPLAADGAFMKAECLFKQDKFADALAAYEGLKTFSNRDFEQLALLHAGQAAGQLKEWQKSADLLTRCTQQFAGAPNAPEALYELGWAMQNLGKQDEAVKLYEQVVAKTDREVAARAQFMIGEIQFDKKNHSDAIRSFFKAAYGYSFPKWQADATYEAGRCFEVLGQKTQAVKMYQELLQKFPDSDRTPLARQRLAELK